MIKGEKAAQGVITRSCDARDSCPSFLKHSVVIESSHILSIEYINWAFHLTGLNPTQKIILISLADNSDTEGSSFPSLNTICKKTGIGSRTTLVKYISQLVEKGLVSREKRSRDNGSQTSTRYQLNMRHPVQKMDSPCSGGWTAPVQTVGQLYEPSINTPLNQKHTKNLTGKFRDYKNFAERNKLTIPRLFSDKSKKDLSKILNLLEIADLTWMDYLFTIEGCSHLMGKNDRKWTVSFTWIIKPSNFEKIINGNYGKIRKHHKSHKATNKAIDDLMKELEMQGKPKDLDND